MSFSRLVIRNLKTGKEYSVSGDQWADLKKKGYASRFTVVEERTMQTAPKTTFIPDEVKEATKAIEGMMSEDGAPEGAAQEDEQPAGGGRRRRRTNNSDHA